MLEQEILTEIDSLAENLKTQILSSKDEVKICGTAYYVSNDGSDANDGKSPQTPWKTLEKVSEAELQFDDAVLFKRGDVFRGFVDTKSGVTYAAYGEGEKPKIYGWQENLADPSFWEEYDSVHHIWKYNKKILDVGTLVFAGGRKHSRKLIPSYKNSRYVCRNDEQKPFIMAEEMSENLDIFCDNTSVLTRNPSNGEDFPVPDMGDENNLGELYLRCDEGNPAEVFNSIEALAKRHIFKVNSNSDIRIDNLCLKYSGAHGISGGGHVKGLCVTNCEIGWIGGSIQSYYGDDPNYPEGKRGSVTRYGNAIEIYGGCEDFTVSNCYIYEVYDAGITHQMTTFGGNQTIMERVKYKNNLIEHCVYSIEYFLNFAWNDDVSLMRDIEISDNIMRLSGYGWGEQRHNKETPAHIKSWNYNNRCDNYIVSNNIFDRSAYRLLHLAAESKSSCPLMNNNTYIQYLNGSLGDFGSNNEDEFKALIFDKNAEEKIKNILGDKSSKVYILGDE